MSGEGKQTNPKDGLGIRKWRQFACVPWSVIAEIGVGMLEGARKYGPYNWRPAGARASVYVDAAIGHIMQWQEGEDVDSYSGLSHITKAITSLVVLRDAMLQGVLVDDRPPAARLDALRSDLQQRVERIVPAEGEAQASPFAQPPSEEGDSLFKGKTIVFTGAFRHTTRAAAKARAEALGAKVETSVSSMTDYVVYGSGAGSNLTTALEIGTPVLNELAWITLSATYARF